MMTDRNDNPYAELERVFHEPNRLAIVSLLVAAADGTTFGELKRECRLTDGNLSRHLKTLESAGAVRIEKTFVARRPRTQVFLSDKGRAGFLRYLDALEAVLRNASVNVQRAKTPRPTEPPTDTTTT
jgi:DNA-binding transcriptional ArsR family regulator